MPSNSNPWQVVSYNRPKRPATEDDSRNVRPRSDSTHSQQTTTQNRFQLLEDNIDPNQPAADPPKPPPVFLSGIVDIKPLVAILDSVAKGNYFLKTINNNQIRIQPNNPENNRKIIHILQEKDVSYHRFQLKESRSFRAFVRNLHHSTSIEELKLEIEQKGHTVKNIYNIKQKITKKPLPLFILELEQKPNNKTIYSIEY